MTIKLGYSRASAPSALRIAEASDGAIIAIQGNGDVNWGRRLSTGLNSDTSNCVNKRVMRELFVEGGVPMPRLYSVEMMPEDPWDEGFTLVGRPDFHTRKRGFWVCNGRADVARALMGARRKAGATHFMEMIGWRNEFRVHIFRENSIRVSQKRFMEDGRKYTTVRPNPDLPKGHLRHAAKLAVAALGLDFGTVDILASEDQTQVWVLEVNCAPGLGGSMPRVWAQAFINHMEGEEDE